MSDLFEHSHRIKVARATTSCVSESVWKFTLRAQPRGIHIDQMASQMAQKRHHRPLQKTSSSDPVEVIPIMIKSFPIGMIALRAQQSDRSLFHVAGGRKQGASASTSLVIPTGRWQKTNSFEDLKGTVNNHDGCSSRGG